MYIPVGLAHYCTSVCVHRSLPCSTTCILLYTTCTCMYIVHVPFVRCSSTVYDVRCTMYYDVLVRCTSLAKFLPNVHRTMYSYIVHIVHRTSTSYYCSTAASLVLELYYGTTLRCTSYLVLVPCTMYIVATMYDVRCTRKM